MEEEPNYLKIFCKVQKHMGWDSAKTLHWFSTANPNLGGVSPHRMVMLGREARLEKWIDAAIDESRPEMPLRGEK